MDKSLCWLFLSLGADRHIDYTTEKFYEVLTDIDFVLDTIGGETRERSIEVVKNGGTIVSVIPPLPEGLEERARQGGVNLYVQVGQATKECMEALAELLRTGAIKAHVSAIYPFAQIKLEYSELKRIRKVI